MKKERTEEEKICKAPIEVTLGGEIYQIAPLVIRDSRVWRKSVADAVGQIPKLMKVTTDDIEAFQLAINSMLVETPDLVCDLFFSYAKELNREKIESVATDAEIADAFREVLAVAFPLAGSLMGVIGATTNQQR